MSFEAVWRVEADEQYRRIRDTAITAERNRTASGERKSSKAEGLFKQVHKTLMQLLANPRHPGLHTHEYDSIPHPYDARQKVFEAYAQNRTPGAYRVFWCYGPGKNQITIIAITPHP